MTRVDPAKKLVIVNILRKLLRNHYYCEDCWYSCPLSEDGCCDDREPEDKCNCGAEQTNMLVFSLAKEIGIILDNALEGLTPGDYTKKTFEIRLKEAKSPELRIRRAYGYQKQSEQSSLDMIRIQKESHSRVSGIGEQDLDDGDDNS